MKIYVFVCINTHSFIYFLCIIIMTDHFFAMNPHLKTMSKPLKTKLSIPFT